MRLVGTFADERQAFSFSLFLNQKGITNHLEVQTNKDWGSHEYGSTQCQIWVYEEDQFEEAIDLYNLFLENPNDPVFNSITSKTTPVLFLKEMLNPPPPPPPDVPFPSTDKNAPPVSPISWRNRPMGPLTKILILLCCLFFFGAQLLTPISEIPENYPGVPIFSSPIQKTILYDFPYTYELIDQLIKKYGYKGLENTEELPNEGKQLLNKINNTPYWTGFYHIVQTDGFSAIKKAFFELPKFEKIKQGEIWRLFSPALFHSDLLHLFFNMLWLVVLGKQIELRLGALRYLLFILIAAAFSNTAQYLMSGPNFIGFSGVLCAMLAFVWVRQKDAPWEGYQLDKATIVFMLLFIFIMAAIQSFSFVIEKTTDMSISIGIANTAHIAGLAIGYLLGKLNVFSWRPA